MGASPSHEDEVTGDDPEDTDDEDVLKMQSVRFRVSDNWQFGVFVMVGLHQ